MKQIRISFKEHRLTNEYSPTFTKYDYTQAFDFENEDDIELIYEKVNLYVHTYYEYQENIRNEQSFKSASAIFLDFDGKDGHNDSTIDEFLDSDFSKTYNWFFYTSKSHVPNSEECFHVILPLDEEITDINTLRATYSDIFDKVRGSNLKCDFKVRDGARLIFPSLNESTYTDNYFDNFRFEYHNYGSYLTSTLPIIETSNDTDTKKITTDVIEYDVSDMDLSPHIKEFLKMSHRSKYVYAKSIMTFINTRNVKSGFTFLDYNRWIALGYTLHSIFGPVNGKKLFRILSKGHPRDNQKSIDDQFNYLVGDNNSAGKNLSILMKLSASIGFSHSMYFKYYFMSKHRFSSTQSMGMYQRMVRILLDSKGFNDISVSKVKIYNFSFKKNTRTFLMEISGDVIQHIGVKLGEMMDIMATMLDIPRQFVTTSITKGIIRRFININGVYDITRYIKTKIIEFLQSTDTDCIRVNSINALMKEIRSYAPSTIQQLLTNKNIELYMFEVGVFTDKRKKRFIVEGSSKPYMAYFVDRDMIVLPKDLSFPKDVNYTTKHDIPKPGIIIPDTSRGVVMTC